MMLVGMRGDLLTLALVFPAVELLPLFAAGCGGAAEVASLPLALRTAFLRLSALFCVLLCVSLRFPGEFAPGLDILSGEGAFNALQLWGGVDYALMLAALASGALCLLILNLARAPLAGEGKAGPLRSLHALLLQGMERAVSILLFVVLFLGYPWAGWLGKLLWSLAGLAAAVFITAGRAWAAGRDAASLRRWQGAGFLLATFSIAAAIAAAA